MTTPLIPFDLGSLPEEMRGWIEGLAAKANRTERAEMEARLLREKLRLILIGKYGKKSESLSDDQFTLMELEPSVREEEVAREADVAQEGKKIKPRKHPGRNPLPVHLPRQEEIIAVEAFGRVCACCGKQKCVIGYEEKEMLDVKPAEYFVRVIKREKLACRQCPDGGVQTAQAEGPKIIEKGKISDALVIDVVIKKYASHLPLYRQQVDLERDHGIDISRSTLNQAVLSAGSLLRPVVESMKADLLAGGYIQADETPVGLQSREVKGRNHQAFEFQYSRPGAGGPVVFDFCLSRAREGPAKFLKDYGGILQCDGYEGYNKVGTGTLVRAGCLAHVRRKFNDALKLDPSNGEALGVLGLIARLYGVEKEAREAGATPQQREELRKEKSAPVFGELRKAIETTALRAFPSSKLGEACRYALNQWERLKVYLDHGVVEIDQNWCENAMRPLAIGRRNWLHIGSQEAGIKIAAILSIFETCKRLKINLRDYLNAVLPKLPQWPINRVAELSPLNWKAAG